MKGYVRLMKAEFVIGEFNILGIPTDICVPEPNRRIDGIWYIPVVIFEDAALKRYNGDSLYDILRARMRNRDLIMDEALA